MKIQIIVGSTREGRFGDKPAKWIFEMAQKIKEWEVELVDLRDWPLPFFDEPIPPSRAQGKYKEPLAAKWAKKIGEADGYIMVSPEYNHGPSAVLKNAIDYVSKEWNKKPVAFISYGSVGGARAIEQLRLVAIELQMAPIRTSVNIPWQVYMAVVSGNKNQEAGEDPFEPLRDQASGMLDMLFWWTKSLKTARENS